MPSPDSVAMLFNEPIPLLEPIPGDEADEFYEPEDDFDEAEDEAEDEPEGKFNCNGFSRQSFDLRQRLSLLNTCGELLGPFVDAILEWFSMREAEDVRKMDLKAR